MTGIRVLIADDETDFVQSLSRVLARRGFAITAVGDGAAAVAACTGELDVVLMDVRMPGMDGLSALKEIRRLAPRLPVIMLSGHADVGMVQEALKNGADDYLLKPCQVEELATALENAGKRGRPA